MNKTLKIAMIIAMIISILFTFSSMSFAENNANKNGENASSASGLIDGINNNTSFSNASAQATGLSTMAGKVIGLIQVASVVLAVILIAVFGFKFIMGSANEKADYQKSFIPLIVGLVVVFAATSIAKLIMSVASGA